MAGETEREGYVKKSFQSELFSKYIRINFLVIFLPLILATFVYWILIQNNYTRAYLDTMKYTSVEKLRGIEELMGSFKATAMQIAFDPELSPYQLTGSSYSSIRAIDKLAYYSKGMQYLDELVIYLNDSEKLYTARGAVDIGIFLDKSYSAADGHMADELRELIERKGYFGTTVEGEHVTGMNSQKRFCVVTYPLEKINGTPYGALIGFYEDDFQERFSYSGDGKGHVILLCTGAMEPVYSGLPAELEYLRQGDGLTAELRRLQEEWASGGENCEARFGNRAFIGKIVHSEVNGWYLIDMVEKRSVSQNIILLQLPMIILIAISLLLLTILLSVVLSVYHYLPIHRLYSLFDKKQEKKKKNELLYLNHYIRNLMEEQSDIAEQLEDVRNIGRMEMVKRLLRGNADMESASVGSQLESLGIRVEGECLTAMVVRISAERPKGYIDLLGNVLSGLVRDGFYLTDMIYKDYFAFLACTRKEEEVLRFAEEILDAVGEGAEYIHIGIGNSYPSGESLKYSLMEAVISVEGEKEAINRFSRVLTNHGEELYWKPLPGEVRIKQALLQGMDQGLEELIDSLHQELLSVAQSHSDQALAFVMHRIFIDLFGCSLYIRENDGQQFLHYTGLDEFCNQLRMFCRMETQAQAARKEARSEERMQSILAFIDGNYERPEMSLALVAETFDMTSSYLSRTFKSATGENFIDYLTGKRLEKAAFLLRNTKYNISRIVEMVGYSDTASFTRKFTRHYNLSPGNYRKADQEKKESL